MIIQKPDYSLESKNGMVGYKIYDILTPSESNFNNNFNDKTNDVMSEA